MSLSDIVSVQITTDSVGVQQAGFGVPLILSCNAAFLERVRTYSSLAEVGEDFATTTPEYLMAAAIFSQEPKPSRIKIGRRANKATQKYTVSVASIKNSTKYGLRIGSKRYEITSDADATNDEIIEALESAIDGDGVSGFTASVTGELGAEVLEIVADSAGNFVGIELDDVSLLSVAQNHADPGLAADLAAIALEDNEWYFLLNPWNSYAEIVACATYAEANEKLFVGATVDTSNISLADGSDSDVSPMKELKTSAFARSALIYHPASDAFADAAWVGRCAPLDPGSETWKFKTLAGISAVSMTSTHETNVEAKNGNHYQEVAGINITAQGTTASGEFIDVIRFRDWFKARLAERIFGHLAAANKIPFTDEGIAVIEADVRAQLQEGIDVGGIAASPAPVVTVPLAANVSSQNKANRTLPDVKFTATLAGAIHAVTISGVVSV